MKIDTGAEIEKTAVLANLKKITNQIFKLLPNREENIDWQTPLSTIVEEFAGMSRLMPKQQENIFPLLCKLEGLHSLTGEDDFFQYRRTIFECLNLIQVLKDSIEEE